MEQASPNEIPMVERRHNLWLAYEQYLHGQISMEELDEVERRYIPDFVHLPVQPSALQSFKQTLHNLFHPDKKSKQD